MTLQAINRFGIAKHVPLDKSISYKDLSVLCSVDESQLRRLVRHAMTHRIFQEPEKGQVAHTASSRLLAEDPRMDSWVYFLTDYMWPATAYSVDAIQKWPGSEDPKEVGPALWRGQETTWFGVIAAAPRGVESFRQSMEIISEGEGWEDSYLVNNYAWGDFKKGTVVDVSIASHLRAALVMCRCPHTDVEMARLAEQMGTRVLPSLTHSPISHLSCKIFIPKDPQRQSAWRDGSVSWIMTCSTNSLSKMPTSIFGVPFCTIGEIHLL